MCPFPTLKRQDFLPYIGKKTCSHPLKNKANFGSIPTSVLDKAKLLPAKKRKEKRGAIRGGENF
jgi:hypothetical protein